MNTASQLRQATKQPLGTKFDDHIKCVFNDSGPVISEFSCIIYVPQWKVEERAKCFHSTRKGDRIFPLSFCHEGESDAKRSKGIPNHL